MQPSGVKSFLDGNGRLSTNDAVEKLQVSYMEILNRGTELL